MRAQLALLVMRGPAIFRTKMTASSCAIAVNLACVHGDDLSVQRDVTKCRRVGARHPHLRPEAIKRIEQRLATARIQVGDELVKEKYRGKTSQFGNEFRIGQNESDQQRLLLAG